MPDNGSVDTKSQCFTLEECRKSLKSLQDGLYVSAFVASLRAAASKLAAQGVDAADLSPLQRARVIYCYGLGSPTASLNARAQLALLVTLLDLVSNDARVLFYDPVLSDLDKQLLESLGHATLSEADAARHSVVGATLFYMPHCDASLYDAVLERNWRPETLADVTFIGNSFAAMHERWSGPSFRRRTGKPTKVLTLVDHSLVTEHPLQGSGFGVTTAFNDTSLHAFLPGPMRSAPALFDAGSADV